MRGLIAEYAGHRAADSAESEDCDLARGSLSGGGLIECSGSGQAISPIVMRHGTIMPECGFQRGRAADGRVPSEHFFKDVAMQRLHRLYRIFFLYDKTDADFRRTLGDHADVDARGGEDSEDL